MPAFTDPPANPGVPSKTEEMAEDKAYDTSTVTTKRVPLANLITHIEGYPWNVEYYHQVLGVDDAPQPLGLSIDPTLQQYHLIRDFEIRVTDPLTYDFTKERRSERLQGEGYVYPGTVVPTRGDVFIADVGDGQVAVFSMIDVTPMSYLTEKCYQVSYRMTSSLNDQYEANLESKVVKTSHYVKDFLIHGKNPILSTDTVNRKQRLDNHGHHLLDMFNREFISPRTRHLSVPSQDEATFDAFVAGFIQRFINVTQHDLMRGANWPEVYQLSDLRATTIWDLLLDQQPIDVRALTDRVSRRMSIVDTWVLRESPYFGGLYYSSMKRLVWPTDLVGDRTTYPLSESVPRNESLSETLSEATTIEVGNNDGPDGDQVLIYPVNQDDNYVFSEAFYTANRANQSWLEHMVTQMLSREPVPSDILLAVCDKAYGWGSLERYYYTPVLLMLIHYTVRGL
jgi:hypothetical protein